MSPVAIIGLVVGVFCLGIIVGVLLCSWIDRIAAEDDW